MKKLLLVCLLIAFIAPLKAQNTLYLSFQPTDLGLGIRYDRKLDNSGIYTAVTYGNYKFFGGYIKDHVKLSIGGIAYLENSFVTFGIAYNRYGRRVCPEGMDCATVFQVFSPEVGVGSVFKNVTVAMRMDILKWESSIDVGFNF
jgi:hypothetical protein